MITIETSFPPSVNNLFKNAGNRRVLSKEYAAWREANGWEIQLKKPGKIGGQVRIDIKLECGRRVDIDNCSKALLDLLVTNGVITGDGPAVVKDLRLRFDPRITGAVVEIFPIPAS